MSLLFRASAVLTVSIALAGCGSSTSPSGSSSSSSSGCGAGSVNKGTLTATINGVSFTATCVTASFISPGLAIGATDGTQSVGVGAISTGPATLNMNNGGANGLVNLLPTSGASWTANAGTVGSSGTLTLTRLDSTGAAGTFSFTAIATAGTGATGTKVVTAGTFSVTF